MVHVLPWLQPDYIIIRCCSASGFRPKILQSVMISSRFPGIETLLQLTLRADIDHRIFTDGTLSAMAQEGASGQGWLLPSSMKVMQLASQRHKLPDCFHQRYSERS